MLNPVDFPRNVNCPMNPCRKYFKRADVSQKKDSYEVIVCHANVIRYFVCRAIQG